MAGEGEGVEEIIDILFAILVRLPPKSVCKFRIVSRRWNDMVTSPYFHKLYNVRLKRKSRLRAFIQPHFSQKTYLRSMKWMPGPKMNILSVCLPISLDKDEYKKLVNNSLKYGFFIACSNGLVLTGHHCRNQYYVLNLVTKQCVSLPLLPEGIFEPNMALLYEEKEEGFVPNYKIIAAPSECDGNNVFPIQIYSSNTREWTKSIMKGVENFKMDNQKPPVVVNGSIHWYSTSPWGLVVMDTKELIVDGGENHIQLIMLPGFRCSPHNFSFTRSSSGNLWFSRHEEDEVIRFWKLPESESVNRGNKPNATISNTKWIVMKTIHLNSHRKEMALSLRNKYYPVYNKKKTNEEVLDQIESGTLTLETLLPWKKTMYVVIRVKPLGRHPHGPHVERIYLYNLVKKSYKWVNYSSVYDPESSCGLYPYLDPLTLSSYGKLGTDWDKDDDDD